MQSSDHLKKIQATILNSIGANSFGQIVGAVYQVISVPLYINAWNVELYGQWLLIHPRYAAMGNMGLVGAAANDMTISSSKNQHQEALKTFQSIWTILLFVSFLVLSVVFALIFLMPSIFLNDPLISAKNLSTIIVCLSIYSLLALQEGILNAGFRAGSFYTLSVWLGNVQRIFEVSCVLIALAFKVSPVEISILMLLVKAFFLIVLKILLSKKVAWIKFGFDLVSWQEIRRLMQPALGFMAFPVTNILKNQGVITLIAVTLGASEIVIFASIRTICNIGMQILKIVQHSFWPEVSVAFAKKDFQLIQKMNMIICGTAFWLGFLIMIALTLWGNVILAYWTLGKIQAPILFLLVMCLGNFASGIWSSGSTILMAINKHSKLALYYLFSTILIVIILSILGSEAGLLEYATLFAAIEFYLAFIVLKQTLPMVHQSFMAFAEDIILFPMYLYKKFMSIKFMSNNTR